MNGLAGSALAAALVAALAAGTGAAPDAVAASAIEEGRKVAFDRRLGNCMSCHVMAGATLEGNTGPPLIAMKARFPDKAKLRARIWDALLDVLRLSRAMTYKSAAAGLSLGGGKGLIAADSRTQKTEAMLRSYGRFVDSLGGRYITTEDVGANAQDMEWIAKETAHVVGRAEEQGGSGNPAVMTGFGVFQAMRACAEAAWGSDSLEGKRVAVQGFGNAASSLVAHLVEAGAELIVADVHPEAVERASRLPRTTIAAPDAIYDAPCDVFAPCALGGTLNERTLPRLTCAVVCGAANNQLASPNDARRLKERGVVYAPDFIANAGGVINVSYELEPPYSREAARAKTAEIHATMRRILALADSEGVTTAEAANRLAEERVAAAREAGR